MSKGTERLKEIEAAKEELRKELGTATEERLAQIKEEAEIRSQMQLEDQLKPGAVPEARKEAQTETRAERFVREGRTSMKMFREGRAVLSTGQLVKPTGYDTEIGHLSEVVSSIVDDVDVKDATGTGSWEIPYRATDSVAAAVTEGQTVGGTGAVYNKVTINPSVWGVLDEVSAQVAKMTPVAYLADVERSAYLALRREAKAKIAAAILASSLAETKKSVTIDATYIRKVVLGFNADESVGTGTKLYLNKEDLAAIGAVRGTNEKKAVFDIEFTDENNGTIKDGGISVPFSILSNLTTGTQLYGQPKSVKLLLWDNYEVKTDEGGDYFKRNAIGVRGLQTAGTDLCVPHGMQIIKQAAN